VVRVQVKVNGRVRIRLISADAPRNTEYSVINDHNLIDPTFTQYLQNAFNGNAVQPSDIILVTSSGTTLHVKSITPTFPTSTSPSLSILYVFTSPTQVQATELDMYLVFPNGTQQHVATFIPTTPISAPSMVVEWTITYSFTSTSTSALLNTQTLSSIITYFTTTLPNPAVVPSSPSLQCTPSLTSVQYGPGLIQGYIQTTQAVPLMSCTLYLDGLEVITYQATNLNPTQDNAVIESVVQVVLS